MEGLLLSHSSYNSPIHKQRATYTHPRIQALWTSRSMVCLSQLPQPYPLLHSAKQQFFQYLSYFSSNPSFFWITLKKKNGRTPSCIPTLIHNNKSWNSPRSKADILNKFFSSCFNKSSASLPDLTPSPPFFPRVALLSSQYYSPPYLY